MLAGGRFLRACGCCCTAALLRGPGGVIELGHVISTSQWEWQLLIDCSAPGEHVGAAGGVHGARCTADTALHCILLIYINTHPVCACLAQPSAAAPPLHRHAESILGHTLQIASHSARRRRPSLRTRKRGSAVSPNNAVRAHNSRSHVQRLLAIPAGQLAARARLPPSHSPVLR